MVLFLALNMFLPAECDSFDLKLPVDWHGSEFQTERTLFSQKFH